MIAACVNSNGNGAACTSLFSLVTPSGGTAPADTIAAPVDLAHNPILNVTTLFNNIPVNSPFQPVFRLKS